MHREVVKPFMSSGWIKAGVAAAVLIGGLRIAQGEWGGLGPLLIGVSVLFKLLASHPVTYSFDQDRLTLEDVTGRLEISRDAIVTMRRVTMRRGGLKLRGAKPYYAVRTPVVEVRYRAEQGEAIAYFSPSRAWWEKWQASGGAPVT